MITSTISSPLRNTYQYLGWYFLTGWLAGWLWGCTPSVENQHFRVLAFGTAIDVELSGVSPAQAANARQQLQQDFDAMHQAWHAWEPGPVGRINQLIPISAGAPFSASPSTLPLLKLAQRLAAQSDYLFDPGIGQLIQLWGFQGNAQQPRTPPAATDLDAWLQQRPSIRHIQVDGFYLRASNPQVKLDFGAIGKGYGIHQAMDRLRSLGIQHAVVNAGGDLQAIGTNQGRPWRIAIRDPHASSAADPVLGILSVSHSTAVFTSGHYERYFMWNKQRYHHILDPRTGYPAEGTASVTVLHADAAVADAAATALFIAGPTDWSRIARRMGVNAVLFVDTQGHIQMTPAMHKQLELRQTRPFTLVE